MIQDLGGYRVFIIHLLIWFVTEKITLIGLSNYYAKKCNYNCSECKMWSCTYDTNYKDYCNTPYDDFSNICGKFKRTLK